MEKRFFSYWIFFSSQDKTKTKTHFPISDYIIWNNSFRKINGILITLIYFWCYKGYKRVTFDSSRLIKKGIKDVQFCTMKKNNMVKNKLLWSFSHTSLMETPMILKKIVFYYTLELTEYLQTSPSKLSFLPGKTCGL